VAGHAQLSSGEHEVIVQPPAIRGASSSITKSAAAVPRALGGLRRPRNLM
jgi:hypothetical protein